MEPLLKQKQTKIHIQDQNDPDIDTIKYIEERDPKNYWKYTFAQDTYELIFCKTNGTVNSYYGCDYDFPDGLPAALMAAYNTEYDVIVSPDDFWITILHPFYCHIQNNAEKLRHLFVDHKDKEIINVNFEGIFSEKDAESLIHEFAELGSKRTKSNIKDLVECNFSTTTDIEKTVSKVVLLGILKNYFCFMGTCCGVRNVIFLGELEDWLKIRKKVELIGKYELDWWTPKILYILDNFIKTYKGDPNKDFWNTMLDLNGNGESGEYDEITGWVKDFYPFDIEGKKQEGPLYLNQIPRITFKAPFILQNGIIAQNMLFAAGFSGLNISNEAFKPIMGYALLREYSEKEIEEIRKKEEEEYNKSQ